MELNRKDVIKEFNEIGVKKRAKIIFLPMIDANVNLFEYGDYLIDVNIGDNKILLVFDNTYDCDAYKSVVYKLINCYMYLDSEYIDDGSEMVMYFEIPKEYLEDFKKFKDGNYSGFSNKFKDRLILNYGKASAKAFNEYSMFDGLYPTEKKRGERAEYCGVNISMIKEVWSKPDLLYEEFHNIQKLREILVSLKEKMSNV